MPRGRIRRSERAARPVSPMIQGRKAFPLPLKHLGHASLYASPTSNPSPSAGIECSPPHQIIERRGIGNNQHLQPKPPMCLTVFLQVL